MPLRRRDLGCFSSHQAAAQLKMGADAVSSSISGRLWWWWQRLFQLGLCSASRPARIPSYFISSFAGRSEVVRRPSGLRSRALAHETGRRGSIGTSRMAKRPGAACHRSSVRRSERARPRLLAHADRVLLDRVQDRPCGVLHLWPRSRRLRTSRARGAHGEVWLVTRGCRCVERPRAICSMCMCVGLSNGTGTSGSRTRVYLIAWQ